MINGSFHSVCVVVQMGWLKPTSSCMSERNLEFYNKGRQDGARLGRRFGLYIIDHPGRIMNIGYPSVVEEHDRAEVQPTLFVLALTVGEFPEYTRCGAGKS